MGLTDGGDIDLSTGDLEAPVADLAHGCELGVSNLELVGVGCGANVGNGDGDAAFGRVPVPAPPVWLLTTLN